MFADQGGDGATNNQFLAPFATKRDTARLSREWIRLHDPENFLVTSATGVDAFWPCLRESRCTHLSREGRENCFLVAPSQLGSGNFHQLRFSLGCHAVSALVTKVATQFCCFFVAKIWKFLV